jgi:MSHA biogenesis protein MshN
MSLINKMLQDLDARGNPGAASMQVHIKPVARPQRRVSRPLVAGAAAGAVLIAVAGGFGWRYLHKPATAPVPPKRAAVVVVAPVVTPPVPAPAAPVAAPAAPEQPAPQADAPVPEPVQAKEEPAEPAAGAEPAPAAPHKMTRKERRAEKARLAAEKKARAAEAGEHADEVAPAGSRKPGGQPAAAAKKAVAAPKKASAAQGREETPAQRAEGAYRAALAALQEGRVGEAVASLQKALQVEPRHDAARQTLVGLLIENKRTEEAMRQLQLGLTLDARQPALAMLLARLQIEHGESGIETLTRTLPYAAGNGEYQALLAGALQRQQRHREAAEQYQAALRTQPQNAVWWMGLGISLQAEKRTAEALDAFQKAKVMGTLSPELQAFVERKVGQLRR